MPTPESIVLDKCKTMLKRLETMGSVVHYDRLSAGMSMNMQGYLKRDNRTGSPDLMAFVKCDEICHVLFLEVKRDDGKGIQATSQKEFESKWIGLHNVVYSIITDAKQIKVLVENIRKKSPNYGKIEDWELPENIG